MRHLIMAVLVSVFCVNGFCGGEDKAAREEREKAEMQKQAEKYRSYAAEMRKQKSHSDENAAESVKQAGETAMKAREELAGILESLADSYAAGDRQKAESLQEGRWEKERELEVLDHERKFAGMMSNIDAMIEKYPGNEDLQKLRERTASNCAAYIGLLKSQDELSRKRKAIEKENSKVWEEIDAIHRKAKEAKSAEEDGAKKK